MIINTTLNYSPNFDKKKRKFNQIKFIIFHYTGMKNEKDAIRRLTNIKSKVSSHYFIKHNGKIITLVPELYISWHAGISSWQNYKLINKHSIGIEISNPGHSYNYKKFSKEQIHSILKLTKYLIKKYKIKNEFILGHSDIAPLRKKDPGEKFPWKLLYENKICIWHNLTEQRCKKLRGIKLNDSKKIYKLLFKFGYKSTNKQNEKIKIYKNFQRRFRPQIISSIVDQESYAILKSLIKLNKK